MGNESEVDGGNDNQKIVKAKAEKQDENQSIVTLLGTLGRMRETKCYEEAKAFAESFTVLQRYYMAEYLWLEGYSTGEIASLLFVTDRTVRRIKARIARNNRIKFDKENYVGMVFQKMLRRAERLDKKGMHVEAAQVEKMLWELLMETGYILKVPQKHQIEGSFEHKIQELPKTQESLANRLGALKRAGLDLNLLSVLEGDNSGNGSSSKN